MSDVSSRHEGDLGGKLVGIAETVEQPVTVIVEQPAAGLAATQHTAWMLVNLLARLKKVVGSIGLVCPDVPVVGNVVPIGARHSRIREAILAGAKAVAVVPVEARSVGGIVIRVGPGDASGDLRAYGEGWCGGVSTGEVRPSYNSPLPFGPYIAACMAAGEVFKKIRMLPEAVDRVESAFFSAWRYVGAGAPMPDGPPNVSGLTLDVALAGVGAVGSTWVHALWAAPGLRGKAVIADNDKEGIEKTNLNRYPLFGMASIGAAKAKEAAHVASDCDICWEPYQEPLQNLSALPAMVISAVDKNTSRAGLQDKYPPRLLSASTSELRAEVLRCGPPGVGPCLRCYNPPEVLPSDDAIRSGLAARDDSEIRRLADEAGVAHDEVLEWVRTGGCGMSGERLLGLIRRREGDPERWAVGFVSVLAGTFLAAETIKEHLAAPVPLNEATPRAVFQFEHPTARSNRAAPILRDPSCPKCDPRGLAASIWKTRYDSFGSPRRS